MSHIILLSLLAIVCLFPIGAWIYFFQSKKHEKKFFVFLTFIAGMLSVIPIKLYERYWDISVWKLEHINLLESLSELAHMPNLGRFTAFVVVTGGVAFGMFVFAAMLVGIVELLSGANTENVYKKKCRKVAESPFFFINVGLLCAIAAFVLSTEVSKPVWVFIVVGMLEEYIKHLMLRFSDEENIYSVKDALAFAVIIALGFAFIENILYLWKHINIQENWHESIFVLYLLRSTVSTMAHVCFSAIFAYFYGIAHFSREIYLQDIAHNRHIILRWLHRILHMKGSTLFHEEKMMEGMLLAMGLHALFNCLLEYQMMGSMLFLLGAMLGVVLWLFEKQDFSPLRTNASRVLPRQINQPIVKTSILPTSQQNFPPHPSP